eukprot:765630-Hanusia_phi.AAC.3
MTGQGRDEVVTDKEMKEEYALTGSVSSLSVKHLIDWNNMESATSVVTRIPTSEEQGSKAEKAEEGSEGEQESFHLGKEQQMLKAARKEDNFHVLVNHCSVFSHGSGLQYIHVRKEVVQGTRCKCQDGALENNCEHTLSKQTAGPMELTGKDGADLKNLHPYADVLRTRVAERQNLDLRESAERQEGGTGGRAGEHCMDEEFKEKGREAFLLLPPQAEMDEDEECEEGEEGEARGTLGV